jgi:hypothetical protein
MRPAKQGSITVEVEGERSKTKLCAGRFGGCGRLPGGDGEVLVVAGDVGLPDLVPCRTPHAEVVCINPKDRTRTVTTPCRPL